jgi:hypothetical protein
MYHSVNKRMVVRHGQDYGWRSQTIDLEVAYASDCTESMVHSCRLGIYLILQLTLES